MKNKLYIVIILAAIPVCAQDYLDKIRKEQDKVNKSIITQQLKYGTPEQIEQQTSKLPKEDQETIRNFIEKNQNTLNQLALVPERAYKDQNALLEKLKQDLTLLKEFNDNYLGGSKIVRGTEIPSHNSYVIKVPETNYILLISGPIHRREGMNFVLGNEWGSFLKENQNPVDTYQTLSHLIGYQHIAHILKNAGFTDLFNNKFLNLIPTYITEIDPNKHTLDDKNAVIIKKLYDRDKIKPLINNLEAFKNISEQQLQGLPIEENPWFWDIKNSLYVDITAKPPVFYYPDTQEPNNEGSYTYIGLVPKNPQDYGIITRKYEHDAKATLDQFMELLYNAYQNGSLKKEIFEKILGDIKEKFGNEKRSDSAWMYTYYGDQIDRDYDKFIKIPEMPIATKEEE